MSNQTPRQWKVRRRPWLVLASFAAIMLGLNILAWSQRARWHAYDPNPYRERLDVCRSRSWDLVVVGGSPAAYAIDPCALEGMRWQHRPLRHACNVGVPLATAAEVYHMVEHGIRRRPRLLIYGICATEFKEDRVEPLGPMFLMDAADVVHWGQHRPEAAKWGAAKFLAERVDEFCPMAYYRCAAQRWAADKLDERWPGLCPETAAEARKKLNYSIALYLNHGFLPQKPIPEARLDRLKANGRPLLGTSFMENYEVAGYLDYLYDLLDWAAKRRVPVVLVELPTSADLEERFPDAFAAFRARLAEVESERGCRVLRPTRAGLGLEERHYADVIHLNTDGAALLTAWLRRQLADPVAAPREPGPGTESMPVVSERRTMP